MYGLAPKKGSIAIGADADLALWNPERETTITWSMLHDNVGYTPYEGRTLRGWPEVVLSRGRVVVQNNTLNAGRGSGRYVPRGKPEPMQRKAAGTSQGALSAWTKGMTA